MTSGTEPEASVESLSPAEVGPVVEERPASCSWGRHGSALVGYLLITTVFFWPVVGHFRTRILSDGGDGAAYLWNLWAIPRALLGGHNPFDTKEIFFPVGAHTAFNTNMPLVSVLSWPLQKVFGLGFAANVMQLSGVVLSGFAAYLLAEHVTRNRPAAFVAGAAFTLAPYRFLHAAHYDLTHLEFLPFGILALLRLYEALPVAAPAAAVGGTPPIPRARRRALAFGAVVGLTLLTSITYFLFLLMACAVVAAWRWRETLRRETLARFAQAGAVTAVVGAPLLIVMAQDLLNFHTLDRIRNWGHADNYSANLWSWVTPSSVQRLWGDRFLHVNNLWTGGERTAFAGFTILALAVVGVIWAGRRRRGPGDRGCPPDSGGVSRQGQWVALAVSFVLLSFGPFLHVGHRQGGHFIRYGIRYTYPMPYWLLNSVPVLNGVRVPGRFSVVAILALDVLAAVGLAGVMGALAKRHGPRLALVAPAVALLLVLVEFFPRGLVTQKPGIPKPYSAIAADPGRTTVLEIPLQWRTGFGDFGDVQGDHSIFLYYATRHGKPLAGGMAARYPVHSRQALLNQPVYSQVVALQQGDLAAPTFSAADLRQAGIGYVVYHRDRPREAALVHLSELRMPVLADDGTVLVWKVP
ncbi:MAG: hypothetical protein ACRDYF_03275 [Acidimicrobiia bacterium]